MEKGHYGQYSGNARHSRVTSGNMAATKRDDEAHMKYLKEDVDYDNKHGHSDSSMTSDEKHISKLAGDLKYDEKRHGAGKSKGAADGTGHKHPHTALASELRGDEAINDKILPPGFTQNTSSLTRPPQGQQRKDMLSQGVSFAGNVFNHMIDGAKQDVKTFSKIPGLLLDSFKRNAEKSK